MRSDIHGLVLLLGRPASGKSEIIDYLQKCPPDERRRRFRVGRPIVLDDFPMLWAWFEEDALLERMGRPRLHSTPDGYFAGPHLWELLIRRLCLDYGKLLDAGDLEGSTVIIEFSRGTEHGGYAAALAQLSDEVLGRAGALYVRVSFEESLRKNRRRFNPKRAHSILEHGLPDDKMERLYRADDWDAVPRTGPGALLVRGKRLPFAVFENEDDVTTPRGEALGRRLEETMAALWTAAGGPRPGDR